ncbi:flavodoxin domain-containing protein [Methanofollis fontis]|nr:flavodoxin domain-containing protein [Methanofollis fontis]
MGKSVLVTYASRTGTTAEIAATIGEELERHGLTAEVVGTDRAGALGGYRAVVIGSPVYMGKLLPDIRRFAGARADDLAALPVAGFVVGIPLAEPTPENRERAQSLLNEAISPTRARDVGLFAGRLDPDHLSFVQRTICTMMKAEFGDFRNEEAIRTWAAGLPAVLGLEGD